MTSPQPGQRQLGCFTVIRPPRGSCRFSYGPPPGDPTCAGGNCGPTRPRGRGDGRGRRSAGWCRSLPVPHWGLHEGGDALEVSTVLGDMLIKAAQVGGHLPKPLGLTGCQFGTASVTGFQEQVLGALAEALAAVLQLLETFNRWCPSHGGTRFSGQE